MAGGIDWFRWHHGSVTDPKFALVAKRAGVSLPDFLAVWAYLLEQASVRGDRGVFGELDMEALDLFFGFDAGQTRAILGAMEARCLVIGGRIASPKGIFPAYSLRPPTHLWTALRSAVFKRDDYTCVYCGARGGRLEADHVVPVCDGGASDETNVRTACFSCNRSKGSMRLEQWRARM